MGDHQPQVRDQDIERLFAEHAQALYAFVAYRTGDRSVAEDVVGDTFERLVATRRRFDPRKGGERNWIYMIALNLLRDQQRRSGSEQRALESIKHGHHDAAASEDPLARIEDRDRLYRALNTLKPEEREVLALRYGADLRLKDIARLTQTPISTVHERLQRGLRDLHQQLEDPPAAADPPSPPPPPPSRSSGTSRPNTRHDR
jgi:RNA polymerase sigma factor (sigma-70 family)